MTTKQTTTWQFNIKAGLNAERKAHALDIARGLYKARFGVDAPDPEERSSSNSISLAFSVPGSIPDDVPEGAEIHINAPTPEQITFPV